MLQPECEDIFARYDLSDEILVQSVLNHLIVELSGRIRELMPSYQI